MVLYDTGEKQVYHEIDLVHEKERKHHEKTIFDDYFIDYHLGGIVDRLRRQ